jgi:ferredoxin
MKRKIIRIDESKCDGCGLCTQACHEGALAIVDGKAKLVSETYCDGLGACLDECPRGAIIIEEREAPAFDEAAAQQQKARKAVAAHGGCPGSRMQALTQPTDRSLTVAARTPECEPQGGRPEACGTSQLSHWPVQLRLLNPAAPFLRGAHLLLCADCVPFTVPDFHARYLTGHAVAVSCPKLDDINETIERLAAIFTEAQPIRVTVLRMEVPCCGGLVMAARKAREAVRASMPLDVHIVGIRGGIRVETPL